MEVYSFFRGLDDGNNPRHRCFWEANDARDLIKLVSLDSEVKVSYYELMVMRSDKIRCDEFLSLVFDEENIFVKRFKVAHMILKNESSQVFFKNHLLIKRFGQTTDGVLGLYDPNGAYKAAIVREIENFFEHFKKFESL